MSALWAFAHKRHTIYLRRKAGVDIALWTDDPILKQFRFCNVYRELDTVTDWLRRNWREPYADMPDLWFAFVVARHMNNIPMLNALDGATLPWDKYWFINVAEQRRLAGEQIFSPAYMIGTRRRMPKAIYLAEDVFTPMWEKRERLRPQPGEPLNEWHMRLGKCYGMGSFLAAQVIADIKHVKPLLDAPDWDSFVASGPGSKRGLNRLMGRALKQPWPEDAFRYHVNRVRAALAPHFQATGWVPPDAQDTQNILCELDKYERVRLGEGRPKQLFKGGQDAVSQGQGRKVQVA